MKKASTARAGKLIHIRLRDEVHKQLKLYVAEHETTLQEVIETLVAGMLPVKRNKG